MEAQKELLSKLETSIKKEATGVLGRIFLFLVYYIGLIVLGILLFWGAITVTFWCVTTVLPEVRNLKVLILIIMCLAGIWALAFMIGLYLIKPLFSFSKNVDKDRVEIKEEDAPELFAMIRDIAQKTACQFPKHIYLNTNVNACVFYDTTFWSIFLPVRKNLEIGLGLFHSTNTDEVKAVIAHEFGHFSQKSMKVGSTVYVTNRVLYNLIYTEDSYERRLDKWCMSETSLWAFFGALTRFMTNQIKRLTVFMYRFVQRGYLRLSRMMEYQADAIACQAVGSSSFISSMYKIEYMSERSDMYERFLQGLLNENKCVENYWDGYLATESSLSKYDGTQIVVDSVLTEPVATNQSYPSNVDIKNVWDSHPSLKDRIDQAKKLAISCDEMQKQSSWSIIPDSLKNKMSDHRLNTIKNYLAENTSLEIITKESFEQWVSCEIDKHFIPTDFKPFFNREFIPFDLDKGLTEETGNPFTKENAEILLKYETAINDWNLLQGIQRGQVEVEELRYKGKLFKRKNLPLKEHEEYLQTLHEKAANIDCLVYSYIYRNSKDAESVKFAYTSIFYVRSCGRMFDQAIQSKNNLIEEINRPIRREEDDIVELSLQINDTERVIKKCLTESDYRLLSLVVKDEAINDLVKYAQESHNPSARVDIDLVKEMINVLDMAVDMHNHLSRSAYSMVIDEVVHKPSEKESDSETERKELKVVKEEVADTIQLQEKLEQSEKNHKGKNKLTKSILSVIAIIVSIFIWNLYFSSDKQNVNPNVFGDDLIEFVSPLELECKKVKADDGSEYFNLTNENVDVILTSGYVSDASDENFETCWENWKETELESYKEVPIDRRNLILRRYNYQYKSVRYDNDNAESLYWEFAILYNEDETRGCICSVWSMNNTINYIDEILSRVKFK